MVNKKAILRVSHELNIYLRYLHQNQNLSIWCLSRRYPHFSIPTISKHAIKKIEAHPKQTKGKSGRKPKLSLRDERTIIRSLYYAPKEDGNFASKRIKIYSGVSSVHDRTVRRMLNKYWYHYRLATRNGLLTENNLKLRIKFAKEIRKYCDDELCLFGICFKLDAKQIKQGMVKKWQVFCCCVTW